MLPHKTLASACQRCGCNSILIQLLCDCRLTRGFMTRTMDSLCCMCAAMQHACLGTSCETGSSAAGETRSRPPSLLVCGLLAVEWRPVPSNSTTLQYQQPQYMQCSRCSMHFFDVHYLMYVYHASCMVHTADAACFLFTLWTWVVSRAWFTLLPFESMMLMHDVCDLSYVVLPGCVQSDAQWL